MIGNPVDVLDNLGVSFALRRNVMHFVFKEGDAVALEVYSHLSINVAFDPLP